MTRRRARARRASAGARGARGTPDWDRGLRARARHVRPDRSGARGHDLKLHRGRGYRVVGRSGSGQSERRAISWARSTTDGASDDRGRCCAGLPPRRGSALIQPFSRNHIRLAPNRGAPSGHFELPVRLHQTLGRPRARLEAVPELVESVGCPRACFRSARSSLSGGQRPKGCDSQARARTSPPDPVCASRHPPSTMDISGSELALLGGC